MDESLQELIGKVEVDASAFKRENDGVDGGVGKRVKGDAESGGNSKGVDFSTPPFFLPRPLHPLPLLPA